MHMAKGRPNIISKYAACKQQSRSCGRRSYALLCQNSREDHTVMERATRLQAALLKQIPLDFRGTARTAWAWDAPGWTALLTVGFL